MMELLGRWIEAAAFVCAFVAFVLITVHFWIETDAHRDARRRNRQGDRW